jgi:hypothetical protein
MVCVVISERNADASFLLPKNSARLPRLLRCVIKKTSYRLATDQKKQSQVSNIWRNWIVHLKLACEIGTRVLGGWALSVLLLSLVLFLLKVGASSSRGAVVTFAVLGGLSLAVSRTIAATLLRRSVRHGTLKGRSRGRAGGVALVDATEIAGSARTDGGRPRSLAARLE